ncbi:MAG: molecular chaperone TorD family protein [Actinomycetota bacterium]
MSRAELLRGLGALCERPQPDHARIADALDLPPLGDPVDEAATFLFEVYPYASVHLGDEGMLGGEARSRVTGFWVALGLEPPTESDHLASLLGLLASLADLEAAEVDAARRVLRREARKALLWEHVLSWTTPFLHAVERVGTEHQVAWAGLLRATLVAEALEFGAPDLPPVALRAAVQADDPLTLATAPVRTGVVLTRTDLVRGARALGVATRRGDRAFALRAMAEQDPMGTGAWLAAEAASQAARFRGEPTALAPVAHWWAERAETTARMLTEEVATDAAG